MLWLLAGLAWLIIAAWWGARDGRRRCAELRGDGGGKVIGFFHPYCDAGGGGERVLWTAIAALQREIPNVICAVYTGDSASDEAIMQAAQQRFGIRLPRPVHFVRLKRRHLLEDRQYPRFTLLMQSIGSMRVAVDALAQLVPDVYIDSTGFAFTLPFFWFSGCRTAAYVHYPTISSDMLRKVALRRADYNNAARVASSSLLSRGKLLYYRVFAWMYRQVGRCAERVMVNSSWTRDHMDAIWRAADRTAIVFPPCGAAALLALPLDGDGGATREPRILSIGQFRPEKDHALQLEAFALFRTRFPAAAARAVLVLLGGCRNEEDRARVTALKHRADQLGIADHVEWLLNVPYDQLVAECARATVGFHTMTDEHFGIGVVEYMSAGMVALAHASAGPARDIVVPWQGQPTGLLARTADEYANALNRIFAQSPSERRAIAAAARRSVQARFTDDVFERAFITATRPLFA